MSKHGKHNEEAAAEGPSQAAEAPKAPDAQEQLLRLKAEFENTKKRLERDKFDAIKYANERLIAEVLPAIDNLDRAMASIAEGHSVEKVQAGLKIAQDELHKVLEQHGVELVKSVGTEFNPEFHEAVGVVETADAEEGSVVEEIQKGYLLNGRLIRPSRVRIAQKKA